VRERLPAGPDDGVGEAVAKGETVFFAVEKFAERGPVARRTRGT
jgi:hypothetical protein